MGRNWVVDDDQIEAAAGNAGFERCAVTAAALRCLEICRLSTIAAQAGFRKDIFIEVGLH